MGKWVILVISGWSLVSVADVLPEHVLVDETRLSGGMRIQINSKDENLSKEQCIALINAYREKGLPSGQVSVHKPSMDDDLAGTMLPYCTENYTEDGISFHTIYHPEAK